MDVAPDNFEKLKVEADQCMVQKFSRHVEVDATRLVVFDVEGVIIPKARFLLFEVVGRMGLKPFLQALFFGLLYETGVLSLKRVMKRLYALLREMPLEHFMNLFEKISLMPDVES